MRHSGRDFPTEVQEVVWRVIKGWKGKFKPGDEFITKTTHANGQCGLYVKPHRARILYFSEEQPTSVSLCQRTAKYWRFGNEQRVLRRLSNKTKGGT